MKHVGNNNKMKWMNDSVYNSGVQIDQQPDNSPSGDQEAEVFEDFKKQ